MGVCALKYRFSNLPRFHPHPRVKYGAGSNPPPAWGGDAAYTTYPLVGEGWGKGLQTSGLRCNFDMRDSIPPLPSPLPQGARGLDCSSAKSCRGF